MSKVNKIEVAKKQFDLLSLHNTYGYFKFFRATTEFLDKNEALLLQDIINRCYTELHSLFGHIHVDQPNRKLKRAANKKIVEQTTKEGYWFKCTTKMIQSSMAWWSDQMQSKILKKLERGGWIKMKINKIPRYRYVWVNIELFYQKIKEAEDKRKNLE